MSNRATKSGNKAASMKTFTYFIPTPPARKSGYREKEFDKIMQGILQSGFKLLELQTQSTPNGVFVIALLGIPNKKIAALDAELDLHEQFKLKDSHSSPDIILDDDDA